jgi:hypothetical protein
MADIASELAEKCGISTEKAHQGLGAVLEFLKSKLPTEAFNKVSEAVPGTEHMMSDAADTQEEESKGVLGAVKGAIGKMFGGGTDAGGAIAKLGSLGLSAEQIQGFIPHVMDYLKGKLPEHVHDQVSEHMPVEEGAAH